jgi:hypothetical protein
MLIQLHNAFERDWLIGLLGLWAVLLFGGFALGSSDARRERRMPAWTRMGSSLTLVVAAWSWLAFTRDTDIAPFSLSLALGMTLGCLGDLFLAGWIPVKQPVLAGITSFGLGHIAYITGFVLLGNRFGLTMPGPRWGAIAAWLIAGFIGWYLVVSRGHQATILHRLALPYALLLAGTAGVTTGLALQAPVFVPAAVGAALFLAGDLILAAQLFNGLRFPLIGDVIWLTYGPAQALLVFAVAAALTLRM